jgi:transposase-like protein
MAWNDPHPYKQVRTAATSEEAAERYFIQMRWPDGVKCPYCGHSKAYQTKRVDLVRRADAPADAPKERVERARRQWKCASHLCFRKFSVTTGTVMERSKIALTVWLDVARDLASAKNLMSALEVSRKHEIAYSSAWFMVHRLREAMLPQAEGKIGGPGHIVEVDETYEGGKHKGKRGRGAVSKKIILSMVDRNSRLMRSVVIPDVKATTLRTVMVANIDLETIIVTDKLGAYNWVGKVFKKHYRVNHKARDGKRFVDGIASTNANESFFSFLKNSIRGTLKHISPQHAHRYITEAVFRGNSTKFRDGERFTRMIAGMAGRRLFARRPRHPNKVLRPLRDNVLLTNPQGARGPRPRPGQAGSGRRRSTSGR